MILLLTRPIMRNPLVRHSLILIKTEPDYVIAIKIESDSNMEANNDHGLMLNHAVAQLHL
jgi:hypothetical protein